MDINQVIKSASNCAAKTYSSIELFNKDFGDYSITARHGRINVEMHAKNFSFKTLCSEKTTLDSDRVLMLIQAFGYELSFINNVIYDAKKHLLSVIDEIKENSDTKIKGLIL